MDKCYDGDSDDDGDDDCDDDDDCNDDDNSDDDVDDDDDGDDVDDDDDNDNDDGDDGDASSLIISFCTLGVAVAVSARTASGLMYSISLRILRKAGRKLKDH